MRGRTPIVVAVVSALVASAGLWLLAGAAAELGRRHVVVDGVPLDEVHPAGVPAGGRPGVVVAHGFAGSARLMAPFGDSLAAGGYVVVLLDFTGHGANTRPLPDSSASTEASTARLAQDVDVAMAHLRSLPDVDPARVAVVGHSMGASVVTRYAAAHPQVGATVAISLPDATGVPTDRPPRLLLLVGGLELPGFKAVVDRVVGPGRPGRSAVVVPWVEHVSVLYAPRTHQAVLGWLDATFGAPVTPGPTPLPLRRPVAAGLMLLALLAGLYPMAHLVLGNTRLGTTVPGDTRLAGTGVRGRRQVVRPHVAPAHLARMVVAAAVASVAALLVTPVVPTVRLPLSLGGYLVGFTATAGAVLLGYQALRRRPTRPPEPGTQRGRVRLAVGTPVLIGYAALTIAVPLNLGLTHAVPVGVRWWLLGWVWAGFAILAYAAERVTDGSSLGVLAISAVIVFALTCAAGVGLAPGFLVLIVPLLAILLLWQSGWSAALHRLAAPPWLIALVGSLLVAWPIATALPVIA